MNGNMNSKYRAFTMLIVLLACCFPLYINLGAAPIYMWDEATYANNALDMYLSHDPIVVRMEGMPDLYNTKPPFVLWMQNISLHLFGWNEFAIRLPSAFFATCTLLLLFWFSLNVLKSFNIAICSVLILVCARGYVSIHVTRSGDLDAILVFWMTGYVLIFLRFLLCQGAPAMHFFLIACGLTGAFLTKGVAGWFFLPMMILISVIHGSFLRLIRQKEVYLAMVAVLGFSAGYYALREAMAPGYWDAVKSSELFRFHSTVMSWHVQPYDFYIKNMVQGRFLPFIYLLPLTFFVFLWKDKKIIRQSLFYLWLLTTGYFLLISYPADKLEWYDAPLYPLLSLMIAICSGVLIDAIAEKPAMKSRPRLRGAMALIWILLLIAYPYSRMINPLLKPDQITYAWNPSETDEFRITGAFMKELKEKYPHLDSYAVFAGQPEHEEHFDQIKFYKRSFEHESNFSIQIKNRLQQLKPGEFVVACDKNLQDSITAALPNTIQYAWKQCLLYKLNDTIHPVGHAVETSQ